MTAQQFKKGINSELKTLGFSNKCLSVGTLNANTIMVFDSLNMKLICWLNNRFCNGIRLTDKTVIINTPFEKKIELN